MEWVPLITVSNQLTAELLVQALGAEGIKAQVSPGDTAIYLGVAGTPCRVLVAAEHRREAVALLEHWEG